MNHAPGESFTTSTLLLVSGATRDAFHKWRSRNGLFPETLGSAGWNRFSVLDACVVRAVVVLTQPPYGLSAESAVNVIGSPHGVRAELEKILQGRAAHRYLGLHRKHGHREFLFTDDVPISDVMRWSGGSVALIDLNLVTEHVTTALAKLSNQSVALIVHRLRTNLRTENHRKRS